MICNLKLIDVERNGALVTLIWGTFDLAVFNAMLGSFGPLAPNAL